MAPSDMPTSGVPSNCCNHCIIRLGSLPRLPWEYDIIPYNIKTSNNTHFRGSIA
ncbi:hypothetical protein BDW69DRAFT_165499 [Aspergillus filifer]